MGRGRIDKKRSPRPTRNRPARRRQIPVINKSGARKWLVIGLLQGFVPRAGELLADQARPFAVWLVGYLAGLLASLLAWVLAAFASYWATS